MWRLLKINNFIVGLVEMSGYWQCNVCNNGQQPAASYLEIHQEPHSNLPNDETDKREDEGEEETLARDQGAATPQEGDGEADQTGRQDGVGDHGELVPAGLEVEMFRHQEGDPGRGEEGPQQHDQGVDSADTAPQHEVTTPTTHLVRPLVLLV